MPRIRNNQINFVSETRNLFALAFMELSFQLIPVSR